MSKKVKKLPTVAELAFYRSKVADGSYIGKNQLAAVFAQLDAETERADAAEQRLLSRSYPDKELERTAKHNAKG